MATVKLSTTYSQMQPLEYLLKKLGGRIVEQQFAEQIDLVIELPEEQLPTLRQSFPLLEII